MRNFYYDADLTHEHVRTTHARTHTGHADSRAHVVAQFTKVVGRVGGRTRRTSRERASVGWMASSSSARAPSRPSVRVHPQRAPSSHLYRRQHCIARDAPTKRRAEPRRSSRASRQPCVGLLIPAYSGERAIFARAGDGSVRFILRLSYTANKNTQLPIFPSFAGQLSTPTYIGEAPFNRVLR